MGSYARGSSLGLLWEMYDLVPQDGQTKYRVAITVDRAAGTARVDFSGTSAQLPNNFNAPRAVWARWSPPDELNRITLACRALLVRTDDGLRFAERRVIFDNDLIPNSIIAPI